MRILFLVAAATAVSGAHVPSWVTDAPRRLGALASRRLALTAGTNSNANALDATGCSAKVADGGWGYCGPASCVDQYITCASADGGGPQTVDGTTGSWATNTNAGADCKGFLARYTFLFFSNKEFNDASVVIRSCPRALTPTHHFIYL